MRRRLLDHAARLPHRWRASHGDEVAVLATRGLDDVVPYVNGYLPQLLMTAILTPVALAVMLWLDLISGLIVAVTLPLVPLFMWLVGVTTQQYSAKRLEALARQGAQLLDLLAGLTTLRGLGREIGPGTRVREARRRLPDHHDADAARRFPVRGGARAARVALGRTGGGRDRHAARLRTDRPRHRARRARARAGDLPAAAPGRRPVPRLDQRPHRSPAGLPRPRHPRSRRPEPPRSQPGARSGSGARGSLRANAATSHRKTCPHW
ncbi:ABC transporter transmembrane domain-containing protein [Salana multivorans]